MLPLTRWTWVWASSGSWWWTRKPVCCSPCGRKELDTSDWTELNRNIPYEPPDVTLTGIMHQFIVRLLEILASNNTNNFVFMIIEYILKIFSYFIKYIPLLLCNSWYIERNWNHKIKQAVLSLYTYELV